MPYGNKTVLIVDDEPDIVEIISETIESLGVKFKKASDGAEALAIIEKDNIDLVITDINMPKMTGLHLLESVKAKQPMLPVVIVTAYGNKEQLKKCWKLGAFDFLDKPLILDEVLRVTEVALAFGQNYQFYKKKGKNHGDNVDFTVKIDRQLADAVTKHCKQNDLEVEYLVEHLLIKFIAQNGKLF